MKIALLGTLLSGKTVYFTGLSYKFRNSIALRPLSRAEQGEYRKMRVARRAGFQISVLSSDLDRELSENIDLLAMKPEGDWPNATESLDRSTLRCMFKFSDVTETETSQVEIHTRDVEVYDPTGGVFNGAHPLTDEIIEDLHTCDVCIGFLPADRILSAVGRNDADILQNATRLGKIVEVIQATRAGLADADILPVCFVISKADLLLHDNVIQEANEIIYDQIIVPFSRENKNLMICVCPTAVLDPKTGEFRAHNLEWPFLFAAGGTIFRNSLALRDDAKATLADAKKAERDADELKRQGWWTRFKFFLRGDGVGARQRRVISYRDKYGRLISQAEDDRDLAKNVWSSLAIEGRERGVRIFMEGQEIDPRLVTG